MFRPCCTSLRQLISWICVLALGMGATAVNAQSTIKIGQIIPLTGPLANVGKEIQAATLAAFADHNASIASKSFKLELITVDDGNVIERSRIAADDLSTRTTALLSCFGTTSCLAQKEITDFEKIPLVGAIAGSSALRGKGAKSSFAVRAGAAQELEALVQFSKGAGIQKIGLVVQDDGFGRGYASIAEEQLKTAGIDVFSVSLSPQAPLYAQYVSSLIPQKPQALMLLANATHSVGLLKAWKEQTALPLVLNLAGQANSFFANGLKGYTGAAAFVTVTPSPWEKRLEIQRKYQASMERAQISNLSYLSFEAYLNACVLIEALKKTAPRSSAQLATVLSQMNLDLNGFRVNFADQRVGAHFTDLAVLRSDGSFKH